MKQQPTQGDLTVAAVAKALGHPVRVQMLRLLAAHEAYCGDLVDSFDLAQSTVSHHLRALKEAGLVAAEEQGAAVCYRLNRSRYDEFRVLIANLI